MDGNVWLRIIGRVWVGETVKTACAQLGLSYQKVRQELNTAPRIKQLIVDTAMLANARDEIINDSDH